MGQADDLVVAGDIERVNAQGAALDVVELTFDDMAAVVVGDGIGQRQVVGGYVGDEHLPGKPGDGVIDVALPAADLGDDIAVSVWVAARRGGVVAPVDTQEAIDIVRLLDASYRRREIMDGVEVPAAPTGGVDDGFKGGCRLRDAFVEVERSCFRRPARVLER